MYPKKRTKAKRLSSCAQPHPQQTWCLNPLSFLTIQTWVMEGEGGRMGMGTEWCGQKGSLETSWSRCCWEIIGSADDLFRRQKCYLFSSLLFLTLLLFSKLCFPRHLFQQLFILQNCVPSHPHLSHFPLSPCLETHTEITAGIWLLRAAWQGTLWVMLTAKPINKHHWKTKQMEKKCLSGGTCQQDLFLCHEGCSGKSLHPSLNQ